MPAALLRRQYWILYVATTAVCAVLFLSLQGVEDGSVRHDRLDNEQASQRAIAMLKSANPQRYANYEVVNAAFARKGEIGPTARWVILCDTPQHSGLHDAVVVEIDGRTGALIRIRKAEEQ